MTEAEIAELFIRAAEVDRRLPDTARPARLKAMSLPYVHSFEDRRGWEPADMIGGEPIRAKDGNLLDDGTRQRLKKAVGDRLELGDRGRYDIEAEKFWDDDRLTPEKVSTWERAIDLIALVEDESQRRCLWAWARAKAGGRPFAHWCRHEEHIAEITGQRRKNRAISQIAFHFARKGLQNKQNAENGVLPDAPEIDHIAGNIAEPRRTSWMADGAFSPIPRPEFRDFSWAAKMAERRRRKREAKKRKMAEAA